jgi:hypothetical protein
MQQTNAKIMFSKQTKIRNVQIINLKQRQILRLKLKQQNRTSIIPIQESIRQVQSWT